MSTVAAPPRPITPAELYDRLDRKDYELIDGRLEKIPVSALSSLVGMTIGRHLGNYLEANPIAWVVGADCGFQCFPWRPYTVRKPDVAVILRDRLPVGRLARGWVEIAPDLAIEVVSPGDRVDELEEKIRMFLRAGTRLVWLVVPSTRRVRIHRADGSLAEVGDDGRLDGEDVLPGFSCPVAGLFPVEEPAATEAERGLV